MPELYEISLPVQCSKEDSFFDVYWILRISDITNAKSNDDADMPTTPISAELLRLFKQNSALRFWVGKLRFLRILGRLK